MASPVDLTAGDFVSVRLPGVSHAETAIVLKVGCFFEQACLEERKDRELETTILRRDGIMVRFSVNNRKGIYAPETMSKVETTPNNKHQEGAAVLQRRTRSARRSIITPSPRPSQESSGSSVDDATTPGGIQAESEDEKKPVAKRKDRKKSDSDVAGSEGEDDMLDVSNHPTSRVAASARRKSAAVVGKRKEKATQSTYFGTAGAVRHADELPPYARCLPVAASAATSRKAAKKYAPNTPTDRGTIRGKANRTNEIIALSSHSDEEDSAEVQGVPGESSGDDSNLDRPFTAEYSPTSRSTCRRCDQIIAKGQLRVSHVPLFRGKPGFRVFRHLSCAVFSEEVAAMADVGGWRTLGKADRQRLKERIQQSKVERQEEEEEIQPDELVQVAFSGEIRPPPKGLDATLLPFQTEGVSWMRHQETGGGAVRGGILGDEMGMGKTVQAIATILDNRPVLQHCRPGMKHPPAAPDLAARMVEEGLWAEAKESWKHEMNMLDIAPRLLPKNGRAGTRAGTLVVCPVVALNQWKSEIEKFTIDDKTLTVGIYHGPNRARDMPLEKIAKYDVVLTTYQCVEQDFRKMMSPNKIACPNCQGKFKIDKLRVHLKYFCGAGAQRTEAQARQRRTIDQNRQGSDRPGNQNRMSDKNSRPLAKKPHMTKSAVKRPTKKTSIRVSGDDVYDSDSDLSLPDEVPLSGTKRPTRSGARLTAQKIANCVKASGGDDEGDGSSYATDDGDPSEDEGSDVASESSLDATESSLDIPLSAFKKTSKRKRSEKQPLQKNVKDAAERAREKQREALNNSKKNTSKKSAAKKAKPASKKAKPASKKAKGMQKFEDSSDSSSSSSSSSCDDEEAPDPVEDIDMAAMIKQAMDGARFSLLHSFCWWRLVLDEAHYIKTRSSQTAAASFALTGIHRWCLSGTPLQNRVGELYSLIRFLRIDPMAHYFCRQKDCSCKSVHYRFKDGKCRDCDHRAFSHYSHFNKYILNAIQRDGYTGDGRRAMFILKNEVLDKSLLRRTKETRAADMNLPPRIVTIRPIRLHPVEEDFYNALYTQTRASFDDYVTEGTLLNNYAHIFDLLTKMRQAVDHPYLIVYSKTNVRKAGNRGAAPIANGSVDCDICHEPPTQRIVSSCCRSGFCRSCVIEYLEGAGGERTPCPSCQAPFSVDLNQVSIDSIDDGTLKVTSGACPSSGFVPSLKELKHVPSGSILRRINLAEFATSTKIEVLVEELISMRKQRPGSKALVFSQFVNMLDLIRWRLHSDPCLSDLGLGVRILHGGMDVKSRDAALKEFRENSDVRILLMSLKAGGVALNLTVASEVYLVDNWWNPAAEMQAIDRTHRLGQHRPIRAVRFVAEGTVEERVLQLQEKKRLVFDGTVGRDAGSLKMLTVNDMKSLFT